MRLLSTRPQRSLARTARVAGIGFVTGKFVTVTFRAAPADTGILFHRTDLGPHAMIHARVDNVTGTNRRTTLGSAPLCVSLVEHVLAALSGLRIDNCIVEIDGPEPPGLDGSSREFVEALTRAGLTFQTSRRSIWAVDVPMSVGDADSRLTLHPTDKPCLRVSYLLNYGAMSPIVPQTASCDAAPGDFAQEIAGARTFLLHAEAEELRRQGLGSRTQVSDLLVFGERGPIDNTLRWGNEPARHKILDIVGDFALLGVDLACHVVACRTGHPHNVEMMRRVAALLQPNGSHQRRAA